MKTEFRAWDIDGGKMHYGVQCGIDLGWEISFGDILVMERFIVMQYTTLKDKNGKEIYVGDFLKGVDGRIDIVKFDEKTAAFIISPVGHKDTQEWPLWMFNGQCEVVGNGFEKTEFLKK